METWQPSSLPITYAEWLERGSSIERLVIHFWAEWNAYDRNVDAKLVDVYPAFEDSIEFRSYDIDHDQTAFDWLRDLMPMVPTLVGFNNGNEIGRLVGINSQDAYRKAFRDWFGDWQDCPPA